LILDLNVIKTDDGYTAEVPSIRGCESWSLNEDEAIDKTLELLRFYIKCPPERKIIVDRAGRDKSITVYKLIFDK
jgi:predicted RNase H-like HicB family nuclease